MEVFISWSGERSEKVAEALRDWLPSVIQSVTPFMSASDIEKGSRWLSDLGSHLELAGFGLICLTPENLEAPWLLFEAGALSKSMENSRVVPYLYNVSQTQIQGPLTQFQSATANKESTWDVIKAIIAASGGNGLEPSRLERTFETWWPQLEDSLQNIPEAIGTSRPSRSERDILEEILRLCRQMSRQNTPAVEADPETLRNLIVHGLITEPAEPDDDVDAHISRTHLRSLEDARRREAIRRRIQERARERHFGGGHSHTDLSLEGEHFHRVDNESETSS